MESRHLKPRHTPSTGSMTLTELRFAFPGYWVLGTGSYALVCSSARRITLFQSLDVAKEAKHASCGRGCERYDSPHVGYALQLPAPVKTHFSSSFRRMVEDA